MAKSTVSISITRSSPSERAQYKIRIKDDVSRALVCEVQMTAEEFAEAITGAFQSEVDVEWGDLTAVGKVREAKTEIVTVPPSSLTEGDRKRAAEEAIREYEVDGWKGRIEDALNHYKRLSDGRYRVRFVRLVDRS